MLLIPLDRRLILLPQAPALSDDHSFLHGSFVAPLCFGSLAHFLRAADKLVFTTHCDVPESKTLRANWPFAGLSDVTPALGDVRGRRHWVACHQLWG